MSIEEFPEQDQRQESFETGTAADLQDAVTQLDPVAMPAYLPDWLGGATALQMNTEVQEDLSFWFPQTGTTCGPASLTSIVEDFTGRDFENEFELRDWAAENGHYTEGFGMVDSGALATLEHFGVPAHRESGDWQTVDRYLEQGRAVVLSVDASEYWGNPDVPDNSYHYVRVLNVDLDRGVATLSDTGAPNGRGMQVPLSVLEEAWDESDEPGLSPAEKSELVHDMIVSDIVDPDGVGAERIDWITATTQGNMDPQSGFVLLPLLLSQAGLANLQAHTAA